MLDLKFIREQPDAVRAGVARKGEDPARVDDVIAIDTRRRELVQRTEALKSRKNTVSADVAKLKAARENADALIAEMRAVADEIKGLDDQLRTVEEQLRAALLLIPNIPHPEVPVGMTPADNTVIAEWGSDPVIDFTPRPHWELLENLDIVDFARGTKITGAGFPVYTGRGAQPRTRSHQLLPGRGERLGLHRDVPAAPRERGERDRDRPAPGQGRPDVRRRRTIICTSSRPPRSR